MSALRVGKYAGHCSVFFKDTLGALPSRTAFVLGLKSHSTILCGYNAGCRKFHSTYEL